LNLKTDIKKESITITTNETSSTVVNLTSTNDDGVFSSDDDMPLLEKYRQQKQRIISANASTSAEKKSTPIEWKPTVDSTSSSNVQQPHSTRLVTDSKNKAANKSEEDLDSAKERHPPTKDNKQISSNKRKVIESSSSSPSPLSADTSSPSSDESAPSPSSSLYSREEEKNTSFEKDNRRVKREPSLQTSRDPSPNKASRSQTPIKKENKQNEQEVSSSRASVKSSPTTPVIKSAPATRRSASKQQTPTETANSSKPLKSQENEDSELIFAPQIKYDSTNDEQRQISGASSEVESNKLEKRTGDHSSRLAANETSKRTLESMTESGDDSSLRKRNDKRKRVRSKVYDDEESLGGGDQSEDTTAAPVGAQSNKTRVSNKKDEFDFDADINENKKPTKIRKIERTSSIRQHQEIKEQNIDDSNENASVSNEVDESSVKDEEEGSSGTPDDVKSRISSLRNASNNIGRLRSKNSQMNYNQQTQNKKRLGSSSSLSQLNPNKKTTQPVVDVSLPTKSKATDSGLVSIIKSEPVQISASSIVSGSDYDQEVKNEDANSTIAENSSSTPALTRANLTKLMSSNSGGASSSAQQELMQSYSISSTSSTISCNSTNSSIIIPNKFEDEKIYKAWKKSIMMVLNNICSHKYVTSVFISFFFIILIVIICCCCFCFC
jgi:hypothetical protein